MSESAGEPTESMPVRRRRTAIGLTLTALATLYVALVVTYTVGESAPASTPPGPPAADGVTVVLTARAITAMGSSIHADVTIDPGDELLGDDGLPTEPITVSLDPTEEDADLVFDAGKRPQSRTATLLFDGDIQNWPFDRYSTLITAFVTVGQGRSARAVDSTVVLSGSVQGWDLTVEPDSDAPDLFVDASFHRTPAIVLFGITLVLVLVLLPVTCWIVGVKLYRERRLFEAGFLGWIAALLFATIPIRNFFPGSPPPGSWVDVLVVLWVIVALAVGLVIGVAAFIRHPRPSP